MATGKRLLEKGNASIKPNKSFHLRKVRPASRKQQPSCEALESYLLSFSYRVF